MHFLPSSLLALTTAFVALSLSPAQADLQKQDLGRVMFVGDSITHGYHTSSYRWPLHKILIDNGRSYEAIGIMRGNFSKKGVAPGTAYGAVPFTNIHSAQASARAWELSGRKSGPRYGGTNINNWLGFSKETAAGKPYADAVYQGAEAPQVFFLMIGTNDLLSDHGDELPKVYRKTQKDLTGDLMDVLKAMRKSNKSADIVLLTVPTWAYQAKTDAKEVRECVQKHNALLKKLARSAKCPLVDVSRGLVDLDNELSFKGEAEMFISDGLHPSDQGNLIIAANIAETLGWPGRTIGLDRKDAGALAANVRVEASAPAKAKKGKATLPRVNIAQWTKKGGTLEGVQVAKSGIAAMGGGKGKSEFSYTFPKENATAGATAEALVRVGDGAKGGWEEEPAFELRLATGTAAGELRVSESQICWGDNLLYATDMSVNTKALRVVWFPGDRKNQRASGFYVWLGDQLIGEALPAAAGTASTPAGVTGVATGDVKVRLYDVAADGTGAFAPAAH